MSMLFFTDTETTGLIDFKAEPSAPHQPHATEVAGVLYDDVNDRIEAQFCALVVPEGFVIDDASKAAEITGITHKRATGFGMPGSVVAATIGRMIEMADEFLAYNVSYDKWIINKLLLKHEVPFSLTGVTSTCVMSMAKPYCKLPPTDKMVAAGFGGYKTPKLTEAYKVCTGKDLTGAHSALADVLASIEVYRFLKQRNADAA